MRRVFTVLIRGYQVATSNFAPRCKYYPSCSNYAITAIGRYGVKGLAMAAWRIVRCNPWSQGGVDYVDAHLDSADVKNLLPDHKKPDSKKPDSKKPDSKKPDSKKEVVGAN